MRNLLIIMMFTLSLAAYAEEEVKLEDLPDAPPPPDILESGEAIEPEVTIIQKKESTVEEYRVNGNLYMVKVTPKVGPAYYLLDQDGDGKMETNMSEIYSDFVVPSWVIFSW